jgi:hypothetical protein
MDNLFNKFSKIAWQYFPVSQKGDSGDFLIFGNFAVNIEYGNNHSTGYIYIISS